MFVAATSFASPPIIQPTKLQRSGSALVSSNNSTANTNNDDDDDDDNNNDNDGDASRSSLAAKRQSIVTPAHTGRDPVTYVRRERGQTTKNVILL